MICGLFVMPTDRKSLAKTAEVLQVFALHTHAPYVKQCRSITLPDSESRGGRAYSGYMSNLCKFYPEGCKGPFTVGVWWRQPAPDSAASL